MQYQKSLQKILSDDPDRMAVLHAVRALKLNDGWVGAGFVRDAVWDYLHGYALHAVSGDVDVVWFDSDRCTPEHDSYLEERLRQQLPSLDWSVKNQARMHLRNGDNPYLSTEHALLNWPETATAVAVRLGDNHRIEITAYRHKAMDGTLFQATALSTPVTVTLYDPQRVLKYRTASRAWG